MRKDIYYGGSFNPFHNGHNQLVTTLLSTLDFVKEYNSVVIDPNHTSIWDKELLPYSVRVDIINESIQHPNVFVNDFPVTNTNNSTYESIKYLLEHKILYYPVSIVIGSDQAEQIQKWYRWEELIESHEFIIVTRPSYDVDVSKFKQHRIIEMNNTTSSTVIRDNIHSEVVEKMMSRQGLNIFRGYYEGIEK